MTAENPTPSITGGEKEESILNVALIGSSGGGTATLGHTDANTLLHTIHQHLTLIHARLCQVIYIALINGRSSMDSASAHSESASLMVVVDQSKDSTPSNNKLKCQILATDTLEKINQQVLQLQKQMASDILNKRIHALICISMHVPLFTNVLQAAVKSSLPVTGSGGSSLAQAMAQHPGLLLAGNAGGSVATTTQTRAISYTYSLAQVLNRTQLYRPWEAGAPQRQQQRPSFASVLNAAIPAFWAVMLSKFFLAKFFSPETVSNQEHISWWWIKKEEIQLLESALNHYVLPAVCATIIATSYHNPLAVGGGGDSCSCSCSSTPLTASLIMASLVASFGCCDSVLAGLLAGYLVQTVMERWVLYPCIFANVPATMTTLLAAGGMGSFVGILSALFISPITRQITIWIRFGIEWTVVGSVATVWNHFPIVAAFVWGCLSCWGSKVGYYHAIHLPLILVELESGKGSFLGAVDELTLVLVCAGICAAKVIITAKTSSEPGATDRALCCRGFLINVWAGDFVEVCYPYMEQSLLINASGYLASRLSCAILVQQAALVDATHAPYSFAYLPWVAAVVLADKHWYAMLLASLVAFGIPFVATLIAGAATRKEKKS